MVAMRRPVQVIRVIVVHDVAAGVVGPRQVVAVTPVTHVIAPGRVVTAAIIATLVRSPIPVAGAIRVPAIPTVTIMIAPVMVALVTSMIIATVVTSVVASIVVAMPALVAVIAVVTVVM